MHRWHGSLLSAGVDTKTRKGNAHGIATAILYLVPDDLLCPLAVSAGCKEVCLFSAGRGRMQSVVDGRMRKTKLYYADPVAFVDTLKDDLHRFVKWSARKSLFPAVRLNGTSDILWENARGKSGETLLESFESLTFYDYTKRIKRTIPANYDLTFSYSPKPEFRKSVEWAMETGQRLAVVFDGKTLPETWKGRQVINGDVHDIRFLDPPGSVIGLTAKGEAKRGGNPLTISPEV